MRNFFVLLPLILFTLSANANSLSADQEKLVRAEHPTKTLYRIWQDQQQDGNAALKFYEALAEKHIVEVDDADKRTVTVTYFAKGGADTDYIVQSGGPDFYGLRFKRLGNSDIYFCTQKIPSDAWFTYGVNEFKRTKVSGLDTTYQTSMEHIQDGAVIGPDAPLSSYIHSKPDTPNGLVQDLVIDSKWMAEQRKIQVYVPANYKANVEHNLVLQFDGQNYSASSQQQPAWQGWTPMPTIMDNLIHQKKIGPTIVIFIHNQGNRSGDLISDKMADFVALELVGWAKEHYAIASDRKRVVVSGPSRAGFAAANTALRHADIIGAVLSQSGSFYYTLRDKENWPVYPEFEGKLVADYKRLPKLDIHFYLDVGLYDLGLGAVGTNRQLRDILALKGYPVDYYQYKGGYSHLGWRHTLANGLIALLNTSSSNR